jgi:HK97 family phage portal protein
MVWPFTRRKAEARATATQSSPREFLQAVGLVNPMATAVDIPVTTDTALGVPAVWSAVNFISGTIAGLPLHVYRRGRDGRTRVRTGVAPILHDAVNDGMSSFEWRKYTYEQVLTGGRAFTFIERNARGRVTNLWPLDPSKMLVAKRDGQKFYRYTDDGRTIEYAADEIIDLPFALKSDGVQHRAPIATNKNAIAMAIAATLYGAKVFHGGGVPPLVLHGPFQSGAGAQRASDDIAQALASKAQDQRQVLVMPNGHELKPLGFNPEDMQNIELQRFIVEEIARIYSLPPVFLQDLTHGTFSNTEQQDLHFVKHTVKRWIEQFEQEVNLKLFGRGAAQYVEFSVDGLLRGDFKTRMDGYAQAIQHGVLTPGEAREAENRPRLAGDDRLYMQGAMMPITDLTTQQGGEDDGV